MTPERWQQINQLFDEAADLQPAERDALLARAEAGDPDLAGAVRRLVAQLERSGGIIDQAVPGVREIAASAGTIGPGQVVAGRFEVRRYLGRTPLGEVYAATGATVHILDVDPTLPEVAHLQKQIEAAKSVSHDNLSRVLGLFDVEPGSQLGLVLAEEAHEGETLAAILEARPSLPCEEAIPIIDSVASALHAIHGAHLVHGCLNPGLIMLTADLSQVRVCGLGLGSVPGAAEALDPETLSPEQLLGEPVTAATDVYALGLIAYEILTGRKPFTGSNLLHAALRRLHEPPPPPISINAALPSYCDAAVMRCLERDPGRRPPSARHASQAFHTQSGLFGKRKWFSLPDRSD